MADNTPAEKTSTDGALTVKSETGMPLLTFSSKDLEGKAITSDVFKDYDVTLVNVWATWCPPCRAELPSLEAAYKKYGAKSCNVIALTSDVYLDEADNLQIAKDILKDSKVTFQALQSIDEFNSIYSALPGLPTSFLVDKEGRIIKGSFHTGALDMQGFETLFNYGLETVGAAKSKI